ASRIDLVRRREGLRRTRIKTAATAAAMILFALVGRNIQRREHGTEKKPRAEFPRDKVRVLALPARTRFLRQRLFHHRCGIDENFHVAAESMCNKLRELFQLA